MSNNQQSFMDTAPTAEPAAIQRSSASQKARNGTKYNERKVWKGFVRGLLVVLLFADAVVVGLLANYYLLGR